MATMSPPPPVNDPLITVVGAIGVPYLCPTIEAVDGHLADLHRRARLLARKFPRLAKSYRSDIDQLLDRRCWLAMAPTPAASPALTSAPTLAAILAPTPASEAASASIAASDAA